MKLDARHYEHVLGFALEHPWSITHSMRAIVAGILARRIAGEPADPADLAAALVNRRNAQASGTGGGGGVAIIPIYGVIAPRMNLLSEMSGGTTFEALTSQLHDALANDAVKTIVFDVDSPGGNVAGATEFAREVLKARTKKPIIAQAQFLMASAAYWPMAAATEIVASPSAMVGSIGVYGMHDDISEALAKAGVKRTVISAGKYKAEGADGGPLSKDALAHIKAVVDATYRTQLTDIANGRGVSADAVRTGYAEGRTVSADDALTLGMIDRIGTLSDTVARALSGAGPSISLSARTPATAQEPARATAQELSDVDWQNATARALLELDL